MKNIINFLFFQIGWFSCVLGAANGYALAGPLVVSTLFTIHLLINKYLIKQEIMIVAFSMLYGCIFDTLCITFGVYTPVRYIIPEPYIPLWFLALWVNFGTTINFSLKVFNKNKALAALLGGVGGPLAYFAGEKLEAISFGILKMPPLLIVALGWALALPLLYYTSNIINNRFKVQAS